MNALRRAVQKTREKGLPLAEAEDLVLAAYHRAKGVMLRSVDLHLSAEEFPENAERVLEEMTVQRMAGVSLQYLTGIRRFLNHDYEVCPGVLIPRPETEVLCDLAMRLMGSWSDPPRVGLEIGIGSGILSVELLAQFSSLKMIASELSPMGYEVATRNARKILGEHSGRLEIVRVERGSDVVDTLGKKLGADRADFLISNPPYLIGPEETDLEVFQNEPPEALFAPQDYPNFFYNVIAERGANLVRPGGGIFLEVPHERAKEIRQIFIQKGFSNVEVHLDLTQRERVLVAWIK